VLSWYFVLGASSAQANNSTKRDAALTRTSPLMSNVERPLSFELTGRSWPIVRVRRLSLDEGNRLVAVAQDTTIERLVLARADVEEHQPALCWIAKTDTASVVTHG
jgi:hypothetical protein